MSQPWQTQVRKRHDRDDITRFCRAWWLNSNWTDELFNGDISDTTTQPPGSSDARRDLSKKARSFTTTTPTTHDRGAGHRIFFSNNRREMRNTLRRKTAHNNGQEEWNSTWHPLATRAQLQHAPPRSSGHCCSTTGGPFRANLPTSRTCFSCFPDFYEILQLTRTQDVVLGGFNKTTESAFFFFFFSAGTASDSQRPPAVFSGVSGWFHCKDS